MTVTVKHSKTNAISDWTQAQLDEQIALGNFAEGTVLADIVLPSDWNNDHTLTGVGTMAEQDANNVAITGGSVNGTTIGATTASTGRFTTVTANTSVSIGANTTAVTPLTVSSEANANNARGIAFNIATTAFPYARINVPSGSGGALGFFASDGTYEPIEQFRVNRTVSAVNYVQVTGAATSANPVISAQGSDSTVNLSFQRKGNGNFQFLGPVILGSNAVNYWQTSGAATTLVPQLQVLGSDTNISMAFQPKGTGAIDLAAGSSGVNISNGGTVTAITRTNSGSGYTTIPSIAITAPTTAGGVQATASVAQMQIAGATIAGGGTGYTVGNTLTIVGGTPVSGAATLTVTTVSAGVITGVSIAAFNNYTALPTNPVSVTGGSGSGATFNLTWAVISFTITNAGSGYIEQPTVTFSGGGGSGAAAYATVGSATTIKGIGNVNPGNIANSILFSTPGGIGFSVQDRAATSVNYAAAIGNVTTQPGIIRSVGSDTNVGLNLGTQGTGAITFSTNTTTSNIQMQVSHTASAVNYVQVTGSATTANPAISTQGSDTNISMSYIAKGTGQHIFATNGTINTQQFRILHTAGTIANYGTVTGNVAGSAPVFSVAGSDTNIDLALTPKGTGVIQFGTHTATADVAISGYITIKDSGGTTRKLAVIT